MPEKCMDKIIYIKESVVVALGGVDMCKSPYFLENKGKTAMDNSVYFQRLSCEKYVVKKNLSKTEK